MGSSFSAIRSGWPGFTGSPPPARRRYACGGPLRRRRAGDKLLDASKHNSNEIPPPGPRNRSIPPEPPRCDFTARVRTAANYRQFAARTIPQSGRFLKTMDGDFPEGYDRFRYRWRWAVVPKLTHQSAPARIGTSDMSNVPTAAARVSHPC